MPIRSDKNRQFTKEESAWFFEICEIIMDKPFTIPFPEAWKYYDAGVTAEKTVEIYEQN